MKYLTLFALLLLLTIASCKKNKPKTELEKLPPITQTGANTFGCLVNGKAWIPKGFDGKPNFLVIVDPTFNGGDIDIRTYRITDVREGFSIGAFPINSTGNTLINQISTTRVNYSKFKRDGNIICTNYQDSSMYRKGFLKITKYDLQNGIVSGEFEVEIFSKNGCSDTLKIINGRFDYKL